MTDLPAIGQLSSESPAQEPTYEPDPARTTKDPSCFTFHYFLCRNTDE